MPMGIHTQNNVHMLLSFQVLSIWEGTTNILSLDVLRAIAKSNGEVLKAFYSETNKRISQVKDPSLLPSANKVKLSSDAIMTFVNNTLGDNSLHQTAARDFAYSLCRTYTGIRTLVKCSGSVVECLT